MGISRNTLIISFLLIFTGLAITGSIFAKTAFASVGFVNLRSTTSEDYRCYASSLLMANNKYDVAINCVNLIFPINPPQVSSYIVWAVPITGKGPLKLGDLGKGIARYEVGNSFSALYVTEEVNPNVKSPSKTIVMNGGVEPITFLQRPTSPTPTSEQAQVTPSNKNNTSQLSTKDKFLVALRRAGIAAVVALVAIVGLIFVVTRSRG